MVLSLLKKVLPLGTIGIDNGSAQKTAVSLYEAIVSQARHQGFYADLAVPDTVDGRFELLSLHMTLALRRLRELPDPDLAETLVKIFFQNMDDSLRELGVGDMSIAKKIRKMAEAFYGRAGAYNTALAGIISGSTQETGQSEQSAPGGEPLKAIILRNIYGLAPEAPGIESVHAERLAAYIEDAARCLNEQTEDTLAAGEIAFPATI